MKWPQPGESWHGRITQTNPAARTVTVHDSRWPELPPAGTVVEIRIVRRSPYWALVED